MRLTVRERSRRQKRVLGRLATPLVAACTLTTGGCLGGLLPDPGEAPAIYRLDFPLADVDKRETVRVVRVDNPSSARTFNTREVLVLTADGKLSAASAAQWSDPIPQLVQDAALARLSRDEAYVAVVPVSGARTDLRLHLDIRNFSARYDTGMEAAPLATVEIYATVSDAATRDFVGSHAVLNSERAMRNSVSAIVDAQGKALQDALDDIVIWMNGLDTAT